MKNYSSPGNLPTVLIAPNAFKGSMDAIEFCRIMSDELTDSGLYALCLPMCDGGDGTARIIASYLNAFPQTVQTVDALGRPHQATYYSTTDSAIIDLASVCGLKDLKPGEYNVFQANTAGLGKVLLHAVRQGKRRILLGVGGSASIDGGLGALTEMGLQIVRSKNCFRNHLLEIIDFNSDKLKDNFKNTEWIVLADVNNPLIGPEGAAAVFGPQKGASSLQVAILDEALSRFAALLLSKTGCDVLPLKHGGAAGGIAATLHAMLGARLLSGADFCIGLSHFKEYLPQVQWVVTGEGKIDAQSRYGKIPGVISTLCRQYKVPVIGIAGLAEPPLPHFDRMYTLIDYAASLPDALRQPGYYLRKVAKDLKRNLLD